MIPQQTSKSRTIGKAVVPVLSIVLLLLIWEAIVVVFNIKSYVAPRPLAAIESVTSHWSVIWPLTAQTILQTIYGFFIGAALGCFLAVIMAKIKVLQRLVYPVLILSQAVPSIALGAPLVLLFGFNIVPKIVLVTWIVFFPVTVNFVDGLAHVDNDLLNLAKVFGASRRRTFFQIEVPAAVGPLLSGLKIGATYTVTGAIIAQLFSSSGSSLALYQERANSNLDTATVFGTTMVMTVIGICWFLIVAGFGVLVTPWQRRSVARPPLLRQRSEVPPAVPNEPLSLPAVDSVAPRSR